MTQTKLHRQGWEQEQGQGQRVEQGQGPTGIVRLEERDKFRHRDRNRGTDGMGTRRGTGTVTG